METWRPISGAPAYEVSDLGRVRSMKWGRPHVLARRKQRDRPYLVATMQVDGRQVTRGIHEIVLSAFVGPRPEGLERRHLNGDPQDNRLANLAYGTHSENMLDKVRHGTHHEAVKTRCPKGHPLDGRRSNGKRYCKTCQHIAWRANHPERDRTLCVNGHRLTPENSYAPRPGSALPRCKTCTLEQNRQSTARRAA